MATTRVLILISAMVQLAIANHMFTSKIYQNLRKDVKGNIVYSSLAAETVLAAVALEGASGQTKKELIDFLENPNTEEVFEEVTPGLYRPAPGSHLTPAYKVYVANDYRINTTFTSRSRRIFRVDTQNVNFTDRVNTANLINSYVESRSNRRLKNFVQPSEFSSHCRIGLVNNLYQSALWKYPLRDQGEDYFYSCPNERQKIKYLAGIDHFKVFHFELLKATYVEFPFQNCNKSFVIIYPDSDNNVTHIEDNIFDYLEEHTHNYLRDIGLVSVRIPKFSTTLKLDFKKYLQELNVKRIFSPTDAELPYLSNRKGLYVNSIPQKAFINITERGNDPPEEEYDNEPTLATHIHGHGPVLPVKFWFEAKRPFIYYIRDNDSTLLLFVGRFNNK